MSCAAAAKNLGLSFSTAKMIVKNYRENGKIF
jgi:transposase